MFANVRSHGERFVQKEFFGSFTVSVFSGDYTSDQKFNFENSKRLLSECERKPRFHESGISAMVP